MRVSLCGFGDDDDDDDENDDTTLYRKRTFPTLLLYLKK